MKQRSLGEWLAYLEQLHPSAIDMGLERSQNVLARLALGKLAPRVVTVTGTNGKGSTCAFVAAMLRAQGLKVGVYSSPHLLRYNERVLIDGQEASDERLCDAFAAVEAARGEISLTYFEMGTLAAFWLFYQSKLDAVVLEVGLGGRLDTVNVVDADLALVTSIGVDHVDYLGDTRESVAYEKAGIFRQGRPALCGDIDPPHTLLDKVRELDCPFFLRGRDYDLAVDASAWHWRGLNGQGEVLELHDLPLLDLPLENAALAVQAYALLALPWQPEHIAAALLAADHDGASPAGLRVTLIESPDVPTIGVGEGTWPTMRDTLRRIGVSETEFVRACDATFKQGSKFVRWTQDRADDHYHHPFVLPQGYHDADLVAGWMRHGDVPFDRLVSFQPQLCDEIIDVGSVKPTGELDRAARGKISGAVDPQHGGAIRQVKQAGIGAT